MISGVRRGATALAAVLAVGSVAAGCQAVDGAGNVLGGELGSGKAALVAAQPVTSALSQGTAATALDWSGVADAVRPSVVDVRVGGGSGSGVVLDNSGHIITNNHVIADNRAGVSIVTHDGRVFENVSVVGTDPETDLAVLRVSGATGDLKPATFGNSKDVRAGNPVMAVGSPLGLSSTVTTGIVSAVDRPVVTENRAADEFTREIVTERVIMNAIQTDAAINHGNSGGALVNINGEVIGINSSIVGLPAANGMSGSIGLGFAIPSVETQRVAKALIADGYVDHAWIGVALQDATAAEGDTTRLAPGIAGVVDNSPAAAAGLRRGDAIAAIDGEVVQNSQALIAQVRERQPGDTITLTVLRNGQAQDISVTVDKNPENAQ